jgi:hypothetical protein
MVYSNHDLGKPRKHRTHDESDSNLVGPGDPDRGYPPLTEDEKSECEPAASKDPNKDDN